MNVVCNMQMGQEVLKQLHYKDFTHTHTHIHTHHTHTHTHTHTRTRAGKCNVHTLKHHLIPTFSSFHHLQQNTTTHLSSFHHLQQNTTTYVPFLPTVYSLPGRRPYRFTPAVRETACGERGLSSTNSPAQQLHRDTHKVWEPMYV